MEGDGRASPGADRGPAAGAEPGEAWRRRRLEYEAWLSSGRAWLLLAVDAASPRQAPDGYAVVRLAESGATWDLGHAVGELESLAVAAQARGRGIGTKLMDAARELLRSRDVGYWSVTVAAGNAGAIRLYEREGFRPATSTCWRGCEIRPARLAVPAAPRRELRGRCGQVCRDSGQLSAAC